MACPIDGATAPRCAATTTDAAPRENSPRTNILRIARSREALKQASQWNRMPLKPRGFTGGVKAFEWPSNTRPLLCVQVRFREEHSRESAILLHRERSQILGACCPHSGREILLRCRKLLFSHCSGVALLLRNHH